MSDLVVQQRQMFSFGPGTHTTRVSLKIAEGLEYDEWRQIGQRLLTVAEASRWWIGDWLVHGEWGRYGEAYRAAVEELELAYDAVRDYAYVAGHVPESVRREDLSWRHHRLVAKLKPADQERWLARAAEHGWSVRRLADEIAQATVKPAPTAQQVSAGSRHVPQTLERLVLHVEADRLDQWRAHAAELDTTVEVWLGHLADIAASVEVR